MHAVLAISNRKRCRDGFRSCKIIHRHSDRIRMYRNSLNLSPVASFITEKDSFPVILIHKGFHGIPVDSQIRRTILAFLFQVFLILRILSCPLYMLILLPLKNCKRVLVASDFCADCLAALPCGNIPRLTACIIHRIRLLCNRLIRVFCFRGLFPCKTHLFQPLVLCPQTCSLGKGFVEKEREKDGTSPRPLPRQI